MNITASDMKHNGDVINAIMEYLEFQNIFKALIVCKSWSESCDFAFFNRLCKARNRILVKDYGNGESVPFDIEYFS